MPKTPVFFIATRERNRPVEVQFYTKKGKPVTFETVKKVKTKEGIQFFATPQRSKRK
jgi:hypothetical protein